MTHHLLDRLAEAYGVQLSYISETGDRMIASESAKRAVLTAMGVAADNADMVSASLARASKPIKPDIGVPSRLRCFMPGWLDEGRGWGITCQLYGVRSGRNHGIGDFEDLARLAEFAAKNGADFIGVNPLHALFTADPRRCSPFSPSNRRFLNPLYIALDRIPGLIGAPAIDNAVCQRLRSATYVDYDAVAALKLAVLRHARHAITSEPARTQDAWRPNFDGFVAAGGKALVDHARFEALSHQMVAEGFGAGWSGWPRQYQMADSDAVEQFAAEHDDEVHFYLWLQWIADTQLADAASRAKSAGMRIGLYLDFAVGAAPDGSATWTDPTLIVPGASIGAPPDSFFQAGQNWGLAPISPAKLRAKQFEPYRSTLESTMRHAGAIRIDHAMSLYRLFWIPADHSATDGCYVSYPLADMVRTIADTSQSWRTVVIGEDLGTVPKGFRPMMQGANMLSYRVLFFERSRGEFRTSTSYARNAFVSASTHDLPPLAAWWSGSDIDLYRDLGFLDTKAAGKQRGERQRDRKALLRRLQREKARRKFDVPGMRADYPEQEKMAPDLAAMIHAYLARSPSRLLGVQYEDLCGAEKPVNVPGTSEEYPNWRTRVSKSIEDAVGGELWDAVTRSVVYERPRQV